MVDIAASRAAVVAGIKETLPEAHVYPQPPDRLATPAVVLYEAETDFVTPGETYGEHVIAWRAQVVCQPSTSNAVMTAEADSLVSELLNGLHPLRPTIDTYSTATLAGQTYLVATVTLQHTT